MAHILVAEDDATTREMIGGILKKQGYIVSYASNGMSAIAGRARSKLCAICMTALLL